MSNNLMFRKMMRSWCISGCIWITIGLKMFGLPGTVLLNARGNYFGDSARDRTIQFSSNK